MIPPAGRTKMMSPRAGGQYEDDIASLAGKVKTISPRAGRTKTISPAGGTRTTSPRAAGQDEDDTAGGRDEEEIAARRWTGRK